VIVSGDVVPRRDTDTEFYVVILSNETHIRADTGRMITCPFIPGALPAGAMALVVAVTQPQGVLLPELVQWLPSAALDDAIGNVGPAALHEAALIVGSLLDQS
jgi:mRNA-degrading endonuclease toxin of MazEF toxin-antitoxin module